MIMVDNHNMAICDRCFMRQAYVCSRVKTVSVEKNEKLAAKAF